MSQLYHNGRGGDALPRGGAKRGACDAQPQPVTPDDDDPRLALRRHTDRCFHRVEEVVREGYIVEGVLIPHDEVAELRAAREDEEA